MFTQGFEKEAGLGKYVGAPFGWAGTKLRHGAETISSGLGGVGRGAAAGARAAEGKTRQVGETLKAKRIEKAQVSPGGGRVGHKEMEEAAKKIEGKTEKDVFERLKRFKSSTKPSFAQRHPLATAGGAFLAGKYMFGDKEKKDEGPQVIYPQSGY